MWTSRKDNRGWSWARGAWVAILTAAAGLAFLVFAGSFEERYGLETLFRLRGTAAAPPRVVLVAINQDSARALDVSSVPSRWPRAIHAALIRSLASRGAAAILFDLRFSEPGVSGDDDTLACAMREAKNVVLLQDMQRLSDAGADITYNPVETLAKSAVAVVPFPLPIQDSRVTRFWTFRSGTDVPTLAAVAAQLAARDISQNWASLTVARLVLKPDSQAWTDQRLLDSMMALRARLRARPEIEQKLRTSLGSEASKAARLSALISLYTDEDTRLLNFRGPPGTISTIPYDALIIRSQDDPAARIASDALVASTNGPASGEHPACLSASMWSPKPEESGSAESQLIRNAVVVVGFSETSHPTGQDTFPTVFPGNDGVQFSGAEVLATGIADLLENASVRTSAIVNLMMLVGVASVIGLAAASAGTIVMAGVFALVPVATLSLGYHLFATSNLALVEFTPNVVELPVGIILSLWACRGAEIKLRRSIDRTVRQWLPPEVADAVLRGPVSPALQSSGETHFAICLATDIQDFTSVAERLSLAELQILMSDYFEPYFAAVNRHGGSIANISGDGAMSAWKTLPETPQTCVQALLAALEICEAVTEFNKHHPETPLPTRLGLHAGRVIFGAVGGADHYVPTLMGDVANTVSRIESLNKLLHTRVLATRGVLAGVDAFLVRPLGTFEPVGKSGCVDLVEVLCRAGESPKMTALVDSFATGLAAFDAEQWDDAARVFRALLAEYPDDGPTSYFLDLTDHYRSNPPLAGAARPIRVNFK